MSRLPHNAAVAESRSACCLLAEMDTSDIRGLLMRVPPPDTTVQCYIVRKKGAMGMFASYKLYLQENVSAGPGHMVTLPSDYPCLGSCSEEFAS